MAKKMGDGLFKRGKVWWIRTDPVTGKQESTGQRLLDLATKVYNERCRIAADPNYQPTSKESKDSVNTWAAEFVASKRKNPNRSNATADFYEKKLGHVIRIFGERVGFGASLDAAFTPRNWDHYVSKRLEEEARPTTIKKEIGAARALAKYAKRRGGFRGDPSIFKPEDLDDDYKPRDRFLTPEELVKLLIALSEESEGRSAAPHRAAHVALSVALGARYSEAFKVQAKDICIKRRTVIGPGGKKKVEDWTVKMHGQKTDNADDVIPIVEPFRPLLAMAIPYLPLRPWANNNQWKTLRLACKRAKIAPVTSNDLRRTQSSWLTEAGVPDSIVARVMRHVDERMVRRVYGRARPERLGGAIAAVLEGGSAVAEIVEALRVVTSPATATATAGTGATKTQQSDTSNAENTLEMAANE